MKKGRFIALFCWMIALCAWVSSCTTPEVKPVSLSVAAAGVFRDALVEVNKLYQQQKPNVVVEYTIAGGRVLKNRIQRGEPFDIFIAASPPPMDELQAKGLVLPETRKNLVSTEIALILPADSQITLSDFKGLTSDRIKTVALGTERLDAGIYTKEILLKLGIHEQIKRKAVWADTDIREVVKTIESKQADAGITFLTEAKRSNQVKVVAVAPPNTHRPLVTTLAVLKSSHQVPDAKALIEFLTSEKARLIFEKYGFTAIK